MLPETKKKLQQEIKVYLLKFPNADIKDLREFLRTGSTAPLIAPCSIHPTQNSKNDIIWNHNRGEAGDLLESTEEKYSPGDMIRG